MKRGTFKRTPEHIEKLRRALRGNKNSLGVVPSKETREKIGSYWRGRKRSEETRKKMSQSKVEWHRFNSKRVFKETSIELKIEEELKKRGIYYLKQVPLCKVAIVDFYLPEHRIVIQADGCYWHNCPVHGQGFVDKEEKDARQDSVLTFNGFNIFRFWEHDINTSVEYCIDTLKINEAI